MCGNSGNNSVAIKILPPIIDNQLEESAGLLMYSHKVHLAKVVRSLDGPSVSVTLQPGLPTAQLSVKDEARLGTHVKSVYNP